MRSRTARCPAIPPVRPGLLLAALAVLATAGQPATATADTARIVPVDPTQHEGPTRASIVVTAQDGGVTTLGPHRFRAEPTALRRSPDGRFFAVLVGDWSADDRGLSIVPTDGRPAFEVPTRTRRGGPYDTEPENFSWTSDSRDVILGNTDTEIGPAARVVLRCSVARRRCSAIPGVDGFAATVPGGIVTSTSFHTMVVESSGFAPRDSEPADADTLQILRRRWRARTALVGPATRTLAVRRASLLDGLRGAVGIVGGPSGALITEHRYQLRLAKHRGRRVVRLRSQAQRWVLIRPDGRIRTVVVPRLTVPKAHSAPLGNAEHFAGRIKAQRAVARPRAAKATGGWLAVTGAPTAVGGTAGLVLTDVTAGGRAALVRTAGRLASATQLVRTVVGRSPTRGTPSLDVVGHEAATDAAIVTLSWHEGPPPKVDRLPDGRPDPNGASETSEESSVVHTATVRVPLDGRTPPTVVNREHEQAAW
jgi:dipeptidyl aminopeptidase/acylaminoacyl peptidase